MKIQGVTTQIIVAGEIDTGAGDGEGQRAKRDYFVFKLESARHAGDDLIDLLVVGLSLGTAAQAIDSLLDLGSQEYSFR